MDFFTPLLSKRDKLRELRENVILTKNTLYCDWTASGLAYKKIERRIASFLPFYANTHSESSKNAQITQDLYEKSRENLKKNFRLDSSFALISCGFGSTAAIKKFQELMGIYIPAKTKALLNLKVKNESLPLVIVGPYEHHSNELSFREGLCEVVRIPLNRDGLFCMDTLKAVLSENKGRKIISSMALASNVSGIVIPYDEISYRIRSAGGIVCFDMSSSSAYFDIPSSYYDVAFLSSHKLLGGIGGSGILIVKKALIDKTLPPTFCGGGVVGYVSRKTQRYFSQEEIREEAGTPGILEFMRGSLAYALREEISQEWIFKQKENLNKILLEFFCNEKKITLYGNIKENKCGIFSFNIRNKNPFEIAQRLSDDFGIMVRAGCACAGPYGHDLLGLEDDANFEEKPGFVRASTHFSHTEKEIKYFCNALKKLLQKKL